MGLLVAAAIVIVLIILISVGLFFYLGSRKPVDSITVTPAPSTSSPAPVTSPAPAPVTSSAPTVAEVRIPDPPPSVSSTTVDPVRTPEPPTVQQGYAPSPPAPIVVQGLILGKPYSIKSDIGTFLAPGPNQIVTMDSRTPVPWQLIPGPRPGSVMLSSNGAVMMYCSRCLPGVVKADQVALASAGRATDNHAWDVVRDSSGKYGFSTGGKFITRCNGCGGGAANILTAHETTGPNGWSSSFEFIPM